MTCLEIGNRTIDALRKVSYTFAVYQKNADMEPTDCTTVTGGESDVGLVMSAV